MLSCHCTKLHMISTAGYKETCDDCGDGGDGDGDDGGGVDDGCATDIC